MPFLKCPKEELLLQFATLNDEWPWPKRFSMAIHTFSCPTCSHSLETIRENWNRYLSPEPEVASSLIKVFARLKQDETLILKGWKFGDTKAIAKPNSPRTSVGMLHSFLLASLTVVVVAGILLQFPIFKTSQRAPLAKTQNTSPPFPLAQIRQQDRNSIQVKYVRPEFIQSVEFETSDFQNE